ncbi:hypothetical protein BDZ97DRAFT_1767909 [Flammula alnicola]|nr:hypothetical protein BDZ97DRAFT_1767909 [Flammula alnicola]
MARNMSTSLLGEYLQRALRVEVDNRHTITQPEHISPELLHDCHHLMQKVLSAFRHKIQLPWSIREYSRRLTACQNVRSAKLEADLMKDFRPLTSGALQLIKTPCIVVDSEDNIVLWYLPDALTI